MESRTFKKTKALKKSFAYLPLFFLLFTIVIAASCQQQDVTTIILVRHAEKDSVGGGNPALSAAGTQRAARLQATLKEYTPGAFYSTDTKRTKETISPWAKATGKEIEIYDPKAQETFANVLKTQTGKTMVVVGHSNTIPALVNLLAATQEYKQLPDNEYSKIFIVTISKNGTAGVKVQNY
ncbi:MAG: hypothetical protein JWQ40_3560 [Segetibacter sp.]|nr:hypothetical protein [Segetibacter sp.]